MKIIKFNTKLISILTIILVSIFTITSTINSKAEKEIIWNRQMLINPEAFLNVEFKDNIHLDNIIENELTTLKNNQGYELNPSTFIINSLSGLSNIGGTKQRISIQGNYSTGSIKKEYKSKLTEVITKIDDLKNNNSHFDNLPIDDKIKLEHQLSKINGVELKAQRYWNWGDDKVLSLSIIGNTANLYDIKEILEDSGHTKQVILTEAKTITKQIEELKQAVEGKANEDKLDYINFLLHEKIKQEFDKLGITVNIEEYMNLQFDNQPEYQREVIENIIQDRDIKSIETQATKTSQQLFNGTNSHAFGCQEQVNTEWSSWIPRKIHLNGCAVDSILYGGLWVAGIITVAGLFSVCSFICGIIGVILATYVGSMDFVNKKCGGIGVTLVLVPGYYHIAPKC